MMVNKRSLVVNIKLSIIACTLFCCLLFFLLILLPMDPNIKIKTEIEELEYDAAGNEYVLMDRGLVKEEYAVVKEEQSGSDHDL